MTTPEMKGFDHLSTPDLAKVINDEWLVIQQSELEVGRKNLPRALAVAEKLSILKVRARRGEWKNKFSSYGLQISYETAALYLRILEKWETVLRLARAKGVDPTLLTIDAARQLLAQPKTTSSEDAETEDSDDASDDDNDDAVDAGVGFCDTSAPDTVVRDLELEAGDMFEVLKSVYDRDDLLIITSRLAAHLGMTLAVKSTTATTTTAAAAVGKPN
jgi:hypothetical protein